MDPQRLLRSLDAALKVNAVLKTRSVIAADHAGYHHSPYDWWILKARLTSPKTCEVCKLLDLLVYRGDWVPARFPYHVHMRINRIKARIHPNCRCVLVWAGRALGIYETSFGLLEPDEVARLWMPSLKELERLTPSQLQSIIQFLRLPNSS